MGRLTEAIKHLIIINVIFFIASQLYGEQLYQWFALYFPKNENFELWQIITHMFMHGGLMHIAFNMYGLWAFGSPLEQAWGKNKFLFFYFSSGLGAALLHIASNYYFFNSGSSALIEAGVSNIEILETMSTGEL
jgi:membrane associated rhomboid family serine protease